MELKKKFEGRISRISDSLNYNGIIIPKKIVDYFKDKESTRFIVSFEGSYKKHCAMMPVGNGSHYILISQQDLKAIGKHMGNIISVQISEDTSKYGMECPEEWEELLNQDPEGDQYFHALTPGLQRSIIYIIGKPKGSDTRIKKGLVALEYLKAAKGHWDFREYNEAYKNFRF